MAENEQSVTASKRKHRSPGYPVVPIDEAIEKVKQVYRKDKRAFTTFEAIAEHMGFNVKKRGGRSGRVVSALRQYGLLDERTGQFRVSDLAFKILETPDDSPEHIQSVKEAALNPPIFRRILNHYSGELPSDAAIRSYLIFTLEFNADTVAEFIRVFRRTIDIANPSAADYTAGDESEGDEQPPMGGTPMQQSPPMQQGQRIVTPPAVAQQIQPPLSTDQSVLVFKISRDSEARVTFSGPVTQEAIEKLRKLLEVSMDTYPTQQELQQPRAAIWRNKDHDQPVTVIGDAGEHGGRRYKRIEGSNTSVPEDELEYTEGKGAA